MRYPCNRMRDPYNLGQHITWRKQTSYRQHGCNITGWLLVADTSKANDHHPRNGMFGSQACLDTLDIAEAQIKKYEHTVRLGIPDLVVEVDEDLWDSFESEGWVMLGCWKKLPQPSLLSNKQENE